jgi:hypothetical protein
MTQIRSELEIGTRADRDLKLRLYRSIVVLNLRLSADEAELDDRFDRILAAIDRDYDPKRRSWTKEHVFQGVRRATSAVRRRCPPQMTMPVMAGAVAAAVGRTAKVATGVANLIVAAAVGAAVAGGVMVVFNQNSARTRLKKGREDEEASVTILRR